MTVTARFLRLAALLRATLGAHQQLLRMYTQPSGPIDVPSHVYANPKPWPLANMTNETGTTFWQRGDHPAAALTTPYAGQGDTDVAAWTGVQAQPHEQAQAEPVGGSGCPWSSVQYTSGGVWGAALNTTGADPVSEHLSTTTLESNWYTDPIATTCVDAFRDGSGNVSSGLAVEMELSVPFGFHGLRNGSTTPAAIYISLSLYLRGKATSSFIWYSTSLFDLDRDVTRDHVFIDTSSDKLIISGTLSGHSAYNKLVLGSALSRNTTFTEWLPFRWHVTAAHVEQGIRDGLARFPAHFANHTLPTSAQDYCVPGFNIELEGTPEAGLGMRMRGLNISRVSF